MTDWKPYVEGLGKSARRAAAQSATLGGAAKVAALRRMAWAIRQNKDALLEANARDVAAAETATCPPHWSSD